MARIQRRERYYRLWKIRYAYCPGGDTDLSRSRMSHAETADTTNPPLKRSRKYLSAKWIFLILTIVFAATSIYFGVALANLQSQFNNLKAGEVNTTYFYGTVQTPGSAVSIVFWADSPYVAVSSTVFATGNAGMTYQVFLDNGGRYHVVLNYAITNSGSGNGIFSCNATPYWITPPPGPSTQTSQNFSC